MASFVKRGESWRAMIRTKGHAISATFDREDQARRWAAGEEARIRGDAAPVVRLSEAATVADLFSRYAKEVSPGKRGWRWEVVRLRALGRDPAFATAAVTFDGAAMAGWRDRRLQSVATSTVNRELNLISAVFSRAIKEWRLAIPVNPVHNIQRPKQPPERRRRVPDDERAAIVKELGWDGMTAPGDIREWIAWSFCFALETMMRLGEILAMTWPNVHERRVHLPMTKNGQVRDVPLSSAARTLLAMLPRGEGVVVPVSAGTFGRYFREAVRGAGIVDLHFHDSRREALTRTSKKLTEIELARASGHSSTRQLLVYYRPSAEDLSDKMG